MLELLYSKNEIDNAVGRIAYNIYMDFHNKKDLVLIGVLKGSYVFLADLSRKLAPEHQIDFVSMSSYGENGDEQGDVKFLLDTSLNIKGKNIILVEDIIDSGNTIEYLMNVFKSKGAKSVSICSLIAREGLKTKSAIRYRGFTVEKNKFVVGYGLDYKESYRQLSSIYCVVQENVQ